VPFDLTNRVALVTGSSTGLGKAIAFGLAEAGAKVALNYNNNTQRANAALDEFKSKNLDGDMFRGDVIHPDGVKKLCGEVESKLGPIDILVLNATPDQPELPIEEYDWDFYQSMLDFFVKSPYLLTRACLPHMKSQKWGRIINITSEVFQRGVSPFTAYVAAKGAQTGFARSLATELAGFGITVNMIAPGWIPVERHANHSKEQMDGYFQQIPAGRWGVPDDVKGASIFLASEEASFVTGQTISVNGGMTVF